jgi:hypothetical protein
MSGVYPGGQEFLEVRELLSRKAGLHRYGVKFDAKKLELCGGAENFERLEVKPELCAES